MPTFLAIIWNSGNFSECASCACISRGTVTILISHGPVCSGQRNASDSGGRSAGGFHSTRISSADRLCLTHWATNPSTKCCILRVRLPPWLSLREVATTLRWKSGG